MFSPQTKRRVFLLLLLTVVVGGLYVAWFATSTYQVIDGSVYRVGRVFGLRTHLYTAYDTGFYEKNYVVVDGLPHVRDPETGKLFPTRQQFADGFESTDRVHELICVTDRWSHFTLQSPAVSTVREYNHLREQFLSGEADYVDNRVEPTGEQVHAGSRALKLRSVAPDGRTPTCKASIHAALFHFAKGDDVWFSAWYYIHKRGKYNTLMDLESTWVKGHPGMRIVLHDGYLQMQLAKWPPNTSYRQPPESRQPMPERQWVHLQVHLRLSEREDGVIQLWQDKQLLIDTRGRTLPFATAILDDFEIGISAHALSSTEAVFYVDDVELSNHRMSQP